MKKNLLALSLAALCMASPAIAGEGVFGIDLGRTKISDSDIKGSGLGVYGGYRFNDSFAAELGYRRLFNETTRMFGVPVEVTGTTIQASLLGYLPVGNDVSLFARLGYGRLKAKASAMGVSGDESESKSLFGLGAEYAFNKSTALRVEWQKPASDTTTWSAGVKFSF